MNRIEFPNVKESFLRWTPRVIVISIAGYYGLGFAYGLGIMAQIDKIAIPIIKHFAGWAGVGAIMPQFQWYAAWGVRIGFALSTAILYELAAKVVQSCQVCIKPPALYNEAVRR